MITKIHKIPRILIFAYFSFVNFLMLVFLAGTNRLASNDEARHISSGVSLWANGDLRSANDFPPLVRMLTVLPLLPLKVKTEVRSPEAGQSAEITSPREQELFRAGAFAHLNPEPFNLVMLARMTGFVWWFLGGWIIFRWSDRLYGGGAGYQGVILWSCCPIVLGYEQLATSSLPSVIACLAATYTFRCYLILPSRGRALWVGLLLGAALLVDFTCLVLLVIFPLLAVLYYFMSKSGPSPPLRPRNRVFHIVLTIVTVMYMLNMFYGFDRSGLPLGQFNFASHALANGQQSVHKPRLKTGTGNRFRRSWFERVIVPVPAEYLQGLDRRWHEWETAQSRDDEHEWPVEVGGRYPSKVGGDLPISLLVTLFICLTLAMMQHCGRPPLADELTLWGIALVFMAMTSRMVGLLPVAFGTLLTIPFAIISASRIAIYWSSARWSVRWLAIGLSAWCIGDCVKTTHDRFFPPNRTIRFRQDLVRQSRKLGLNVPEPRLSVGLGPEERGLIYRDFIDSKGKQVNYALFIPESYHGDRSFPLILFLHGWGDRKKSPTDRMFTEVGLPFTLKYRSIDFLVLIPQGISGFWAADGDDARRALESLDAVQEQYRVDPKRISLTGLSSGGSGVWDLAAQNPGRWAAIVPVAGSCDPNQAHLVKQVPCWCFHNRYDKSSPIQAPREMVAAMRKLGSSPRYVEYSDTNHNAGERAYILPELYNWLSRQRLP